ncbi:iron-sulfur cluster assembly accessory protein [Gloeothece verrucosa]|uniref:Iron-sulfur cluster assembly accessory protein n=1 Tax=Gloeothece verrucosa (strain PCC 7822) TaxID=497965 RepID=E0UH24_GLOV7|nr:iron-sulfur cluster assembly accessory protein [Gloeothece verrucosa]ADN15623.1 iron-sulfur cluster assembly accessory protein [Gloeothece verrucosa PCC 7822]
MTVSFTDKAAFRLRTFLRGTTESGTSYQKGIRVGVIDGGCSGYEYSLEIVGQPNPEDLIFEQDKMQIYVDPKSAPLLEGIVIDFVESLTQAGFTFKNPNATSTCGCGKSFSAGECTPAGVSCS